MQMLGEYSSVMVHMCVVAVMLGVVSVIFFFQAEDGIRDLVRSRGLGDVYKRQWLNPAHRSGQSLPPLWAC